MRLCYTMRLWCTAREDHRGEVSSAYFAGLYVFLACPAIGVGLIAAQTTFITAGVILCVLVIALAIDDANDGLDPRLRAVPADSPQVGSGYR